MKTPARTPKTTKITPVKQGVTMATPDKGGSDLLTTLQQIADDEDAAPQHRIAAARAVMEAKGELGKHQRAPGDGTGTQPLSDATRPELEAELSRLRLHFAAQRNA